MLQRTVLMRCKLLLRFQPVSESNSKFFIIYMQTVSLYVLKKGWEGELSTVRYPGTGMRLNFEDQ